MNAQPQNIIGQSPALAAALDHLSILASIDRPVLVLGERGTGKELAAERLHFLSPRWSDSFVKINCGAITETLLESELFGHEAGAFTGATKQHIGRFERADGGTLFLDELGTMSLRLQEKLLRLIEYGEFERVGGQKTISVDVRVIAATNADLPAMADKGEFRWDLLDRLSFDVVRLPPLRERPEDIEELATHFAIKMVAELGWDLFPGFTEHALETLNQHHWPGNVREIKNVVERSIYRWGEREEPVDDIIVNPFSPMSATAEEQAAARHAVTGSEFTVAGANSGSAATSAPPSGGAGSEDSMALTVNREPPTPIWPLDLRAHLDEEEKRFATLALEATGFSQKQAAKKLSLSYDQMRALVRKHELQTRSKRS